LAANSVAATFLPSGSKLGGSKHPSFLVAGNSVAANTLPSWWQQPSFLVAANSVAATFLPGGSKSVAANTLPSWWQETRWQLNHHKPRIRKHDRHIVMQTLVLSGLSRTSFEINSSLYSAKTHHSIGFCEWK